MWRALAGKVAAPHWESASRTRRVPQEGATAYLRSVRLTLPIVVLRPQAWSVESRETKCRRLVPHKKSNRRQVHSLQRTKSPSSASSRRSPPTRRVQHRHSPHQQSRHRHPRCRRSPSQGRLRLLRLFLVAMQLSHRVQHGKKRKTLLWRGGTWRMVCRHAPLLQIQRLTVLCQRSQALLSAAPPARYAGRA